MNQETDHRILVSTVSVPRFLTSAPLMFQYQPSDYQFQIPSFGAASLPSGQNIGPAVTQYRSHSQLPSMYYGAFPRGSQMFPPLQSTLLSSGWSGFQWPVMTSPVQSSSILGSPMSAFSSPGATVLNLSQHRQAAHRIVDEHRKPLTEVGLNVNKVCNEVKNISFDDSQFDNLNVTLSSNTAQGNQACPVSRRSVVKPRGELVGLRVQELEEHLRRQSLKRQSLVVPKSSIPN